jgi:CheY-like chemotaxis protein
MPSILAGWSVAPELDWQRARIVEYGNCVVQGIPKRGRVLVLDDEQCIIDTLRRVLRSEHDIVTSTSPTEVLAAIMGGERFDAILCDLMMPRMTGMEIHAALVTYSPGQAERMIFVTGGATRDTHELFLRSLTLPCLYKPFDIDVVRQVVRGVVGRLVRDSDALELDEEGGCRLEHG